MQRRKNNVNMVFSVDCFLIGDTKVYVCNIHHRSNSLVLRYHVPRVRLFSHYINLTQRVGSPHGASLDWDAVGQFRTIKIRI